MIASLATAPSAGASGASLVRDIVPGRESSFPAEFTKLAGRTFFRAWDPTHGQELWRTDGTASGTRLFRDINPHGGGYCCSGPTDLTKVNGTLFFDTNDGTHGRELWRSDGTAAGTRLVRDINPGGTGSYPNSLRNTTLPLLVNIGGTLFFSADDGTHGQELWRSNGTYAGTRLVRDINPGGKSSSPFVLTNIGGTLFFRAQDGIHGNELWRSDGTRTGTRLVRDIKPGGGSSYPSDFTNVAGTIFFAATDRTHGSEELWRTDGTASGTRLVRDINPDGGGSVGELTNLAGTAYFNADDGTHGVELWRSDGTAAGTRFVRDIDPGAIDSDPDWITNLAGRLVFFAIDPTHGRALWRSDGTAAGTRFVRDIDPLSESPFITPRSLVNVNGRSFSIPRTSFTAGSCGAPTAPTQGRGSFATSTRARRARIRARFPTRSRTSRERSSSAPPIPATLRALEGGALAPPQSERDASPRSAGSRLLLSRESGSAHGHQRTTRILRRSGERDTNATPQLDFPRWS